MGKKKTERVSHKKKVNRNNKFFNDERIKKFDKMRKGGRKKGKTKSKVIISKVRPKEIKVIEIKCCNCDKPVKTNTNVKCDGCEGLICNDCIPDSVCAGDTDCGSTECSRCRDSEDIDEHVLQDCKECKKLVCFDHREECFDCGKFWCEKCSEIHPCNYVGCCATMCDKCYDPNGNCQECGTKSTYAV